MDIFCQIEKKLDHQVLDQTDNFYLLYDGYPLLEGHLLLIPKQHVDCYSNLDKKLLREFNLFKKGAINFLKDKYSQPVIFEHGIAGQTVMHAHLHLLPTNKSIEKDLKQYGVVTKNPSIPYLYFEYFNKKNYYNPKKKYIRGYFTLYTPGF
ncbi:hypothetical protein A3A46_04335 [Candidatus Roizmanbacteria bacterium RIFCSPLOWO2_01_FULL_37_13]|uniref:HIT domain-containing protein n=1 Tax=Candidatus Roizmanbacteria bacterium RIFCSPHIGHO2_02_FULL_38_11 TaxID=1802039 RepID=A0A1F7H175_9BACT|nr:MAG: hypothetical protein A3C25_03100 [Candidatus Roizmanbacteria bacterium RIFCSPHIGHO2_02_FULL_38_11]OGK41003.1 MAG: hypothetical protein A3A46_04335 [Candidatus Roizmanbacteria bacterium RIFCSPLOWO2_01_FULL_37_13]